MYIMHDARSNYYPISDQKSEILNKDLSHWLDDGLFLSFHAHYDIIFKFIHNVASKLERALI